ncbi:MAG: hypothetical protein HOP12_01425 [Candidatus Eisenbacteria bacterium]|uniref:EfeO-type cupredoxin-like domain-containing protein n=1 Tax=Eiseniibacteriota bacterium TaxID=2212470 RepID=A0A849SAW3_UNCEI|nr:hypothetical protein [Candidatus Eisenbacteria bacterium]
MMCAELRVVGLVTMLLAAGCASPSSQSTGASTESQATTATDATTPAPTEVTVLATSQGFEPAEIAVAKGQPATIVFKRTTNETCATEAVFGGVVGTHTLPLDQEVRVELAADRADSVRFACGMDMWKGVIVSR